MTPCSTPGGGGIQHGRCCTAMTNSPGPIHAVVISTNRLGSAGRVDDPCVTRFDASPLGRREGQLDRILVVDDEQPVREALAALLRQDGYRVVVAESGHVAVEAIEAFTF